MKNVAEFTIIGRVSATKALGKVMRVTIASNYRIKDEGRWAEDTHLERSHGVQPRPRRPTSRSTSRRATWFMCAAASGRTATSGPMAAWSTRWT